MFLGMTPQPDEKDFSRSFEMTAAGMGVILR